MAGTTLDALVGARVARLRIGKGWTQLQLSQALLRLGMKCDASNVSRIESGSRPLKLAELVRVSVALSVAPVALLPEESADIDNDETDLLEEHSLPEVTAREFSWWFTGGLAKFALVSDPDFYMQHRTPHPLRIDNPQNSLLALIASAMSRADDALDQVPADTETWRRSANEARLLCAAFFTTGDRVAAQALRQYGP